MNKKYFEYKILEVEDARLATAIGTGLHEFVKKYFKSYGYNFQVHSTAMKSEIFICATTEIDFGDQKFFIGYAFALREQLKSFFN